MFAGDHDVEAAAAELAARLPEPLVPLARVAYNYAWSWAADGPNCFAALDPDRWMRVRANPVRMLRDTSRTRLSRAAGDADLVRRIAALSDLVSRDLARPAGPWPWTDDDPVAFMCAEFGVHPSLPVYSGGLGVLAGDLVKEASDLALPLVGVGLLYLSGYFHQRIDTSGMQHEYWIESDPTDLPCVPITDPTTGERVTVEVAVNQEDVVAQLWRVDVGRVPLVLLDTDRAENSIVGRWITSRLYEGNRAVRLAQYAVLGVGGVRALAALGVRPSVYHLNEGHPALAAFELLRVETAAGRGWDEGWANVVDRLVFTTHTPVPAGNETYSRGEVLQMLGRFAESTGDPERFLSVGRIDASNPDEPSSMTVLGLRASRSANGVSRRHGEVARAMWHPLFPDRAVD
ncbi:MAG TPA: alpha-glucan family phosphorylase, partial [Acidimicrobiales bacterium]|nr:alpha-glucan family phosphorylase [Acidimicrobiales bacterium]